MIKQKTLPKPQRIKDTDLATSSRSRIKIKKVLAIAREFLFEEEHAVWVGKLAMVLFDQLRFWHGLGPKDQELLSAAALLHDIGWIKGGSEHNKTSRDLILGQEDLPFSYTERLIIALICRYHRGLMPQSKHKYFSLLDKKNQQRTLLLAGLLRLADGLDNSHAQSVTQISCQVNSREIILIVNKNALKADRRKAWEKSDLFCQEFSCKLRIKS